jgi:hypothetical protein
MLIEPFQAYKIIPSKPFQCQQIHLILAHIADEDFLALGEVNQFYKDREKGTAIYIGFTAVHEMEFADISVCELEKKIQEMAREIGNIDYSNEISQIFKEDGLYSEWFRFDLCNKIPDIESEINLKLEKQIEMFGKLVGIFSKQANYYKYKKFNLGNLLKDSKI